MKCILFDFIVVMSLPTPSSTPDDNSNKRPDEKPFCHFCQVTFAERKNLNRHVRKYHPTQAVPVPKHVICGMCPERFLNISHLHSHLQSDHSVCLKFLNETFYSEEDFLEWKMQIEKEGQSCFVLKDTYCNKKDAGVKHTYYKCHRSGLPILKTNRKRRMKMLGSIKSGCTCPAIINVSTETVDEISEIKVVYQSVHVGHDLDVGKLRLTKEQRTSIASSLNAGVPIAKILDESKEKYSLTRRFKCITRKDLHNIRRDFNIDKTEQHKVDATSLDKGGKKMKNDKFNPIVDVENEVYENDLIIDLSPKKTSSRNRKQKILKQASSGNRKQKIVNQLQDLMQELQELNSDQSNYIEDSINSIKVHLALDASSSRKVW